MLISTLPACLSETRREALVHAFRARLISADQACFAAGWLVWVSGGDIDDCNDRVSRDGYRAASVANETWGSRPTGKDALAAACEAY